MAEATRRRREALVIRIRGDLTAASGAALLDRLRESRCEPATSIVVDLSQLTHLDVQGAEALLDAHVATTLRRGTFAIRHMTARGRAMLDRVGLTKGDAPHSGAHEDTRRTPWK